MSKPTFAVVLGSTLLLTATPLLAEPSVNSGAATTGVEKSGPGSSGAATNSGRGETGGSVSGPASEKDTSQTTKTGGEPGGNPDKN